MRLECLKTAGRATDHLIGFLNLVSYGVYPWPNSFLQPQIDTGTVVCRVRACTTSLMTSVSDAGRRHKHFKTVFLYSFSVYCWGVAVVVVADGSPVRGALEHDRQPAISATELRGAGAGADHAHTLAPQVDRVVPLGRVEGQTMRSMPAMAGQLNTWRRRVYVHLLVQVGLATGDAAPAD